MIESKTSNLFARYVNYRTSAINLSDVNGRRLRKHICINCSQVSVIAWCNSYSVPPPRLAASAGVIWIRLRTVILLRGSYRSITSHAHVLTHFNIDRPHYFDAGNDSLCFSRRECGCQIHKSWYKYKLLNNLLISSGIYNQIWI